ncbi:MAG: thioredoxin family protein [Myxococcales bacterium]|nr:thioredoxin family protein [Myxococcales bacterium]
MHLSTMRLPSPSTRRAAQKLAWLLAFGVVATSAPPARAEKHAANVVWLHRAGTATLESLWKTELARGKPVIAVFTADWCTPCKALKTFLDDDPKVKAAAAPARFLFIDVDEWRGPAQSLIAGVNAQMLPTVVRVDAQGKPLVTCFGTDLGLLSAESAASNIKRLIAGQAPERPDYEKDPNVSRDLAVADNARQIAKAKTRPPVSVQVLKKTALAGGGTRVSLRLQLSNASGARRFVVMPKDAAKPLSQNPKVALWRELRFTEHVRATVLEFEGEPAFWAIPVAGFGSADIAGLEIDLPPRQTSFEVWTLASLTVGTAPVQFQKKLPYALTIARGAERTVLWSASSPPATSLVIAERHPVTIP